MERRNYRVMLINNNALTTAHQTLPFGTRVR